MNKSYDVPRGGFILDPGPRPGSLRNFDLPRGG